MLDVSLPVRRAFFGRFGLKTRPLQDATYSEIRADRDVLVIAPTGSGKTESVFVPVACRLLERARAERSGIGAIVVSPTRALASDLHGRMAPVFESLGLRLDVATGDRDTRSPNRVSDVLIRTPEGLDSTLCRQPASMQTVLDVVIDEIHLFLSDARGTQLVGLLHRLSGIAPGHRRLGVSATIHDPSLPDKLGLIRANPVVVEVPDEGNIEFLRYRWTGTARDGAESFQAFLRRNDCLKILGFVRTRARAEEMVAAMKNGYLHGQCRVHHAGTSSRLRRETEALLRQMPVGLVVATSTLEVGIDIGDVDTCILFDAPDNPGSLLQRAGRAGRRDGRRRVVYTAGLFDSATDFAKVIAKARSRARPLRVDPRPWLSGCIQQCASYVTGRNRVSRAEVVTFLVEAYGMSQDAAETLLAFLVAEGMLDERGDELLAGPMARELFVRRSLHLTFAGYGGDRIIDEATGRTLGTASARPGELLLLGGRGRKITRVDPGSGAVFTTPAEGGGASFAPAGKSPFEVLAKRCAPRMGGQLRA